ncbi:hypothetical protein [Actinoplanes sp. TBRC 11911]|nr:hypothetical protein [Actinoplanes sp. TBRC 11911]
MLLVVAAAAAVFLPLDESMAGLIVASMILGTGHLCSVVGRRP